MSDVITVNYHFLAVITIGWEQTLYVVNESVGLVELCAVAIVNGKPGGEIQATIPSISIILQNGSAVSGKNGNRYE